MPRNPRHQMVIVGGGFGGVTVAVELEKRLPPGQLVDVTLISAQNYLLITPLLFEAGSGILEPRHCVSPIRSLLRRSRFVEAKVTAIDIATRKIQALHQPGERVHEVGYDTLILAMGGVTNRTSIPGSSLALAFKTLADAITLRNRIIDLFEQADVETDVDRRRRLLTILFIGGGLVGVELAGELVEFVRTLCPYYRHICGADVHIHLCEVSPCLLREMPLAAGTYATRNLQWSRSPHPYQYSSACDWSE